MSIQGHKKLWVFFSEYTKAKLNKSLGSMHESGQARIEADGLCGKEALISTKKARSAKGELSVRAGKGCIWYVSVREYMCS